jgi:hypothetical protein
MLLGQLSGGLAAATGACLLLAWKFPAKTQGAVSLLGVLIAASLLNGMIYADLPVAGALLLAAAAPAALGARVVFASLATARRTAVALAVAAAFVAAGVAAAVAHSPPLDY